MRTTPPLFDVIFALWPNDVDLASDMDVARHCARQWMYRGYVPMEHWPRLMELCAQKGKRVAMGDLTEALVAQKGAPARSFAALEPILAAERLRQDRLRKRRQRRTGDDAAVAA